MGQTLGYQLLAEGVETNAQLTELSMLGCDLGQGYLFGRPMDAVAILDAIRRSVSLEEGVSRKYSAEQTAADAVHDSGEP
jgi:EAL domain-containing protein (putative c-di-GMP-specific phosphodiesterase class I)